MFFDEIPQLFHGRKKILSRKPIFGVEGFHGFRLSATQSPAFQRPVLVNGAGFLSGIQKDTAPGTFFTLDFNDIRFGADEGSLDVVFNDFSGPNGKKMLQRYPPGFDEIPVFLMKSGTAFFTTGAAPPARENYGAFSAFRFGMVSPSNRIALLFFCTVERKTSRPNVVKLQKGSIFLASQFFSEDSKGVSLKSLYEPRHQVPRKQLQISA